MSQKIFHQVVRYEYAKSAVEALRSEKVHSILEVGAGAHGNLAEYFSEDQLTFLDIELPEEVLKDPRFVLGDATALPYEDNSFDFVIALDVLEHIPKEKRVDFIASINRVAKVAVIISVPHYSGKAPYEDSLLKKFYENCGICPPVWIDEHIDCTLPEGREVISLISEQGIEDDNFCMWYGVKRSLAQKMLIWEAMASRYEQVANLFEVINDDYIKSILTKDMFLPEEEAMKMYVVWSKYIKVRDVRQFIGKNQDEHDVALQAFESKYSELVAWALKLGVLNEEGKELAVLDKLFNSENEMNSTMKHIHKELKDTVRDIDDSLCETKKMGFEIQNITLDVSKDINSVLDKVGALEKNADSAYGSLEELKRNLRHLYENERPKLSVVLITYNHEEFIRDTLESILDQETTFTFNIIVADDCSTDSTIEIIKEYSKKTDIPFIFLNNEKNLGTMLNYKRAFAACEADYVAIMEGDDLWIDKHRLQKHVEFLEQHVECSMTFNRFIAKNFETGWENLQPRFSFQEEKEYYRYVTGHDLAYDNLIGNFSTCVYRTGLIKCLPEQLYSIKCYDWLTNIMMSRLGYIGCLNQPMSVYRVHSKGVWSGRDEHERIKETIEIIDVYDEFTSYEFSGGFAAHKGRLFAQLHVPTEPEQLEKHFRVKVLLVKFLRKIKRMSNYLPPFLTSLVKMLIPRVVMEKIERNI